MNEIKELDSSHAVDKQVLTSTDLSVNVLTQQVYLQNKLLILPNLSYLLLVELMTHWPQTRTQDELIHSIWGKVQVQNSTLNQRVKLLRQSLKEQGGDPSNIALVRGVGYRFAEKVKSFNECELEKKAITKKQTNILEPIQKKRSKSWKTLYALVALVAIVALSSTLLQWLNLPEQGKNHQSIPFETQRKSITVAPFISSSHASSYATSPDDYLANSFTAEVSSSLAEVSAFQVIRHNSASKKSLTIQEAGETLQVDNVLTGNIARIDGGFNVDIQLLSTTTNKILWAQSYQVSKKDFYFLKFDIAQELKAFLIPNDNQRLQYRADPRLINPKAYDFYLKAMDYHRRNSEKANLNAQTLIMNAYELSPSCLDIISGYAAVLNSGVYLGQRVDGNLLKSTSLANKAIELYPNNYRGYVALANSQLLQQNTQMAVKTFEQALSLSPENVGSLIGLTKLQITNRQFKKALANIELLKVLQPSSTTSLLLSGNTYAALNLYAQAQGEYGSVLKIEPDNIDALIGLARINLKQGDFTAAQNHQQSTENISPNSSKSFYLLLEVLFSQQNYPQLIKQIELNQGNYEHTIFAHNINELLTLARLLLNPSENSSEITQKISNYQTTILEEELTEYKFSYLITLLKAAGKTEEVSKWQRIQRQFISDNQKSII